MGLEVTMASEPGDRPRGRVRRVAALSPAPWPAEVAREDAGTRTAKDAKSAKIFGHTSVRCRSSPRRAWRVAHSTALAVEPLLLFFYSLFLLC